MQEPGLHALGSKSHYYECLAGIHLDRCWFKFVSEDQPSKGCEVEVVIELMESLALQSLVLGKAAAAVGPLAVASGTGIAGICKAQIERNKTHH